MPTSATPQFGSMPFCCATARALVHGCRPGPLLPGACTRSRPTLSTSPPAADSPPQPVPASETSEKPDRPADTPRPNTDPPPQAANSAPQALKPRQHRWIQAQTTSSLADARRTTATTTRAVTTRVWAGLWGKGRRSRSAVSLRDHSLHAITAQQSAVMARNRREGFGQAGLLRHRGQCCAGQEGKRGANPGRKSAFVGQREARLGLTAHPQTELGLRPSRPPSTSLTSSSAFAVGRRTASGTPETSSRPAEPCPRRRRWRG